MKLNYKRTFFIGLAFMSICAFWQLYDYVVPYFLQYTFRLPESITGAVMAADNLLALFLLPFFGSGSLSPLSLLFLASSSCVADGIVPSVGTKGNFLSLSSQYKTIPREYISAFLLYPLPK